jgi:multiple sugar transport system ATP-binding protein
MAKVRLENVNRKFGNVSAIENINLEIPDGEFWVLVGPSGCGKSTILRTIAGLQSATSGNIYFGDTLVNQIPARQRDVAMVFQNYALYPHMTVAENLAFGLKMRGENRENITKKVESVGRSLSIEHLLKRKPKQLSGGQQQRVALGRAIIRQPQVFLLDEPLSNLDAQLRDDTRAELKQLHQRLGITTIYVTHDQIEAMTLADQIVVLDQGKIQQIGSPQEIYNNPANRMVATFIGNPQMNILPAIYQDQALIIDNYLLTITENLANKISRLSKYKIDLGIRAENIKINQEKENNLGSLNIEIELIEPLGKETLVRGNLVKSNLTLNLNISPSNKVEIGQIISVKLDLEQLYLFDPVTGENLDYILN